MYFFPLVIISYVVFFLNYFNQPGRSYFMGFLWRGKDEDNMKNIFPLLDVYNCVGFTMSILELTGQNKNCWSGFYFK